MPDDETVEQPDSPDAPKIDPGEHANALLENALLRAGVDLDSPRGQLVKDAWTGKQPDLEAIKAHWELVKPPETPAEPLEAVEARIDGEQSQAGERRDLSATSVVEPNPEDVDPRQAAVKAGLDVLAPSDGRPSGTRMDAAAAVVHTLAEAAANGDGRVLVDEPAR